MFTCTEMSETVAYPGPDLLAAFIERHDIKVKDAARALGVTRATLWAWLNREGAPGKVNRAGIAVWTSGEVPESSWPPLERRRKQRADVIPFAPTGGKAA